jgi:outer membrane protein TolC
MKNRIIILTIALISCFNLFGQNLDELLQKLVTNNSELKAVNNQFLASQEKIEQESQLPNASFGAGVPLLRPETRLGPQITMISASQMFPWFGAFKTKENVMIEMSKVKYEEIASLKLDLFYQIKEAYYKLTANQEKIKVLEENISLYNTLEQIALSKVESGKATTADVFRVQLKRQKVEQAVIEINFVSQQLAAIINQLTRESFDNEIVPTENFNEIDALNFDSSAYRLTIQNHPKIAMLSHQSLASENRQSLSQKMNAPMIGFGIDYSLVSERTDANPINNGRDILIPKVMLSIPLYQKKNKSVQKEEQFIQEGIDFQKTAIEDLIMRQLINIKTDYDKSLSQVVYYEKQMATTKQALEILLANYSGGGTAFDEVLQLYSELLVYQLDVLNSKLQIKLSVAQIEKLTDY